MQKKCILVIVKSENMRLFHAEQPHYSFIDIPYNQNVCIDLNVDVIGDDILIGQERNSKNRLNYINPIRSAGEKTYRKNGNNELNALLFIDVVKKVLLQSHQVEKGASSFSIAITEILISVVYDLGVDKTNIDLIQSQFSEEPFRDVFHYSSTSDYYTALPQSTKPSILLKSVGQDLYYFYKASDKLKQYVLAGLAKDPLLEATVDYLFTYIERTNAHLPLDINKEFLAINEAAQSFIDSGKDFDFGSVVLSNGVTAEFQVILAECKVKAEQTSNSGLIIKKLGQISDELNLEMKDLKLFYTGTNIDSDYFKSLFAQKISDLESITGDYVIKFQQNVAREFFTSYKENTVHGGVIIEPSPAKIVSNAQGLSTGDSKSKTIESPFLAKTTTDDSKSLRKPLPQTSQVRKKTVPSVPKPLKSSKITAPPPPPPPPPPKSKPTSKDIPKKVSPAMKERMPSPPPPPPPPLGGKQNQKKESSSPAQAKKKRRSTPPPPPPPPPLKK